MIKIEFDEKSVFTYSPSTLTIHAWDHKEGKFKGDVIGEVGSIKFAGKWQVYHFMEMLEFLLAKLYDELPVDKFKTLPTAKYLELKEDQEILRALQAVGVDNWEGYEMALDYLESNT